MKFNSTINGFNGVNVFVTIEGSDVDEFISWTRLYKVLRSFVKFRKIEVHFNICCPAYFRTEFKPVDSKGIDVEKYIGFRFGAEQVKDELRRKNLEILNETIPSLIEQIAKSEATDSETTKLQEKLNDLEKQIPKLKEELFRLDQYEKSGNVSNAMFQDYIKTIVSVLQNRFVTYGWSDFETHVNSYVTISIAERCPFNYTHIKYEPFLFSDYVNNNFDFSFLDAQLVQQHNHIEAIKLVSHYGFERVDMNYYSCLLRQYPIALLCNAGMSFMHNEIMSSIFERTQILFAVVMTGVIGQYTFLVGPFNFLQRSSWANMNVAYDPMATLKLFKLLQRSCRPVILIPNNCVPNSPDVGSFCYEFDDYLGGLSEVYYGKDGQLAKNPRKVFDDIATVVFLHILNDPLCVDSSPKFKFYLDGVVGQTIVLTDNFAFPENKSNEQLFFNTYNEEEDYSGVFDVRVVVPVMPEGSKLVKTTEASIRTFETQFAMSMEHLISFF
jgi:hypothetical protein